jgi:ATP/maltotriose-dependent transcriptional regulator MalT
VGPRRQLIGREPELAAFAAAAQAATTGSGAFVLVTGEAGVGKTRLAEQAVAQAGLELYASAARSSLSQAYDPIAQLLRACLPRHPELQATAADADEAALVEALRQAFEAIGARGPAAIMLDDLQWADDATLHLLPELAARLRGLPILLVALIRDEVPADTHRLRLLRAQLRRVAEPVELRLGPLDRKGTAELATLVAGRELEPDLVDALHERTQGIPFYVEELAATLALQGRSADARRLPLPETVLDAVLLRTDELSADARAALETAAVTGELCDTEETPGLEEALAGGFLVPAGPGQVRFRHALVRDAVYHAIPWTRRQALHTERARALEAAGAPAAERATQWLGAGDVERGRAALAEAAAASVAVHAYGDAARLYERALDLGGGTEAERFDLLERLAVCAELAGDLGASARAWREVTDGRRDRGELERLAAAQHAMARVLALRGSTARALDAWFAAADAFAACGRPHDAARSRLDAAEVLHNSGSLRAALTAVHAAMPECEGGPSDLRARVRTLEGVVLGKLGETERGLAVVRDALEDALSAGEAASAAAAYQGLAVVYENAGEFGHAANAFQTAIDYCATTGVTGTGTGCAACLTHVLRQRGEWRRSLALCRTLLDDPDTDDANRAVAAAVASQIHASRGDRRPARRRALEAAPVVRQLRLIGPEVECSWTLARLELMEGSTDAALDHCRDILRRWEESDDRHYALNPLAWSAGVFAAHHRSEDLRRAARALAAVAAENGNAESLAMLAGALGQVARESGDLTEAVGHFRRALDLHRDIQLPHDRAELLLNAGATARAAGLDDQAREWLTDARLQARRLGARPLQAAADQELAALDGGGAEPATAAGLTARQLQVVRLVAAGRTNREIAGELFLSVRTVDMHVHHALVALGCRSRLDAAQRAAELGLLAPA